MVGAGCNGRSRRAGGQPLTESSALLVAQLTGAAQFTRRQVDSSTGAARAQLTASAEELERLAARANKNAAKSPKSLDYAFARNQVAEAQLHSELASAAFAGGKAAAAGAELIMVADHFERAFADAGQTPPDAARKAIDDARALGMKMTQGASVPAAEVETTFSAVTKEIADFAATAAKLKG